MKNTKKQLKIFLRISSILIIVFFSFLVLTSCKNEHEDIDEIVTIVDAEILEIYEDDKSFLVKGLGQNNILGDKSYVSTKEADYIEVIDGKPININFDDFSIGDKIIVDVVSVAESYPTQTSTERVELIHGANPVFIPGLTYENYQWILIRDDKTSDWQIDSQGY